MTDRRAEFERFVSQSSDGLLRAAYLIVWDAAEAEDLVQETFLKVARRWPRVRRMAHPMAYARRILVNQALNGSARRARTRRELTGEPPPDRADGGGDPAGLRVDPDLIGALAELAPRQRAVLVLRYFLDLPEAEVAEAMGCSLGTVKSTSSRGLARLEQALRPTLDTRSIST